MAGPIFHMIANAPKPVGPYSHVVEADGWRYHRTPSEQATDHRRDQAHAAAGLITLRFPEKQIRHEPQEVVRRLAAAVRRLTTTTPVISKDLG